MASIILPPGSAPANPSEGEIYYDNTAKQVKFRDNAGFKGLGGADLQGEPHIITKKLFPAYLGKLLDDTTSHSGDYGTEQADGRMYYYTDIAGSKPIHDPRIGAHFGSQRHKFKSLQLLEQETATHGSNVYSIDGREWARAVDVTDGAISSEYALNGTQLNIATNKEGWIEIVGYFNAVNLIMRTYATRKSITPYVNGVVGSTQNPSETSVSSPLISRYVDSGSVVSLTLPSISLGINTLLIKDNIESNNSTNYHYGIELIAQDTTSSSTKVQIQVPAQDVVSYGRKFSVSATAQHYDPFNGFTSGASVSSYVDTATSLGLSKWLHSGTYYRPYNGMRVVKWIDENGAIKTSVTCMPPNAKSVGNSSTVDSSNSSANAKANASVANDTFYPTFEAHTTDVNEDNLHEVAKSFHWREFGNGSANGGTGATWADASMLATTADDIAYVMDDGLTSLTGNDVRIWDSTSGNLTAGTSDSIYFTFIGTGVTTVRAPSNNIVNETDDGTFAQNLPYGTHIFKYTREEGGGGTADTIRINGVKVFEDTSTNGYLGSKYFNIYQPKKPPIPDSACVLADYMVFADFKPQTTAGDQLISKGVRRQNISRDCFCDETDGNAFTFNIKEDTAGGFRLYLDGTADSDTSMKVRIPSFGTNYVHRGFQSDTRSKLFIGDTDNDSSATKDNTSGYGSYAYLTSSLSLGVHQFGSNAVSGQNGNVTAFDIVTPIHTSHHYQTFETPFLHELIGGDRSMEQTNLICSLDGKSWDEVTRDVSYLASDIVLSATNNTTTTWATVIVLDEWRGQPLHGGTARAKECFNKDSWAIAYDRLICLKDGTYEMFTTGDFDQHQDIYINGVSAQLAPDSSHSGITLIKHLKRGDYIQPTGDFGTATDVRYSHFYIKKIN